MLNENSTSFGFSESISAVSIVSSPTSEKERSSTNSFPDTFVVIVTSFIFVYSAYFELEKMLK